MLQIEELTSHTQADTGAGTLTLPFDRRQKSRQRCQADDGTGIALCLPRGTVLRGGDVLRARDGRLFTVRAAPEPVSTASTPDQHLLTRAAYHLGNRHVPLQIGQGWLRYVHDHVLDDMVRGLGLTVRFEDAPFEPEAGAHGAGAIHGHSGADHGHHHGQDDHDHHHGHHQHDHHHHGHPPDTRTPLSSNGHGGR